MPDEELPDPIEGLREVLSDDSTRWSYLPPQESGELIALVYSEGRLLRVVRLDDGEILVIVDGDTTAKEAAHTATEVLRSVRGPLPGVAELTRSFALNMQTAYIYRDEGGFKLYQDPINPLPMEPPTT